jgi:hypothetical protein
VHDFDWKAWDQGEKQDAVPIARVREILSNHPMGLKKVKLVEAIKAEGVSLATAYRRIDEATKASLIYHHKDTDIYTAK